MKLPEKWQQKHWATIWAAILIVIVVVAMAIYGAWNRAEAQSGHVTVSSVLLDSAAPIP